MALPIFIIGAALLAGGAILYAFWDEIKEFLQELVKGFKQFIRKLVRAVILGTKIYLKTGSFSEAVTVVVKQFYLDENQNRMLKTTTTTTNISAAELEEELGSLDSYSTMDITDAANQKLELEL